MSFQQFLLTVIAVILGVLVAIWLAKATGLL